jgi:hypothetical protein
MFPLRAKGEFHFQQKYGKNLFRKMLSKKEVRGKIKRQVKVKG